MDTPPLQSRHLRNLFPLNTSVCQRSGRKAMFSIVDFSALFTRVMPDLMRKCTALGSQFCPVCELVYFTIHLDFHSPGLRIVSLQSHGLKFWTNPSRVAVKYIFNDQVCSFHLILALDKKCKKNMEKEQSHQNIHALLSSFMQKFQYWRTLVWLFSTPNIEILEQNI